MSIGEVGERSGLQPSAIRYYESLGLLPKPPRVGGKRRYDESVLEWLSLIALAREGGFTMAEIKRLVTGFVPGTHPAARWEELATRKLAEIDAMVARAERMRAVLRIALDCGCFRLDDCSALLDTSPVDGQSPCILPAAARHVSKPGKAMRYVSTLTRVILLGILLGACGDSGAQRTTAPDAPAAPLNIPGNAAAIARELGRGVNFGNILEAPSEGAWGLRLSDDLFDAARASGATTIRLPVRWSNHALTVRPFTIDPTFFARVDYAIDAALARQMRIVVDMHHHHQLDGDALEAGESMVDPAVLDERFVSIWRQIATRYRDRPTTVLFELYNEPHGTMYAARWNTLLSSTLDAVRAIDSTRYIVVGPVGWNSAWELANLRLPSGDQRLIVTVHNYEPFAFTHQGASWAGLANSPTVTCCTPAQLAQIAAPVGLAARWRDTEKRPIWVGEFGSYGAGPYASRVVYTRAVRDSMEAHGLTWAYWELAAGFGIYDQPSRSWKSELRDALFR